MHTYGLLGVTVMREPVDKCTKIRILLHSLLLSGYCFLHISDLFS